MNKPRPTHLHPTVPLRNQPPPNRWLGTVNPKPWDHLITTVIPCIDHAAETAACIRLLQLQTCRPHIILIDTGSTLRELCKLEALRRADVELHLIRRNAIQHPCDLIASALDLGFSLADTPYVYTTHQDCFLRSRHFLQHLVDNIHGLAAIGYRISPRKFPGWERHFGHTATLFSLAEYDRLGLTWSLRRAAYLLGRARPENFRDIIPEVDTEACLNTLLIRSGVRTSFIGYEDNFVRTLDDHIDHPRSVACTQLYHPLQYPARRRDCDAAMKDASARIHAWETTGPADPQLQDTP